MKVFFLIACFLVVCHAEASAVEYYCVATKKTYASREFTKADLKKYQFATKVEDLGEEAYLSRCSYVPSEKKVTCDRYKVDRIEVDVYAKIKKYYVFHHQFNFQLFSSLAGIEDDGRGGIQFSKCEVLAP